jgi:hypothetical protein
VLRHIGLLLRTAHKRGRSRLESTKSPRCTVPRPRPQGWDVGRVRPWTQLASMFAPHERLVTHMHTGGRQLSRVACTHTASSGVRADRGDRCAGWDSGQCASDSVWCALTSCPGPDGSYHTQSGRGRVYSLTPKPSRFSRALSMSAYGYAVSLTTPPKGGARGSHLSAHVGRGAGDLSTSLEQPDSSIWRLAALLRGRRRASETSTGAGDGAEVESGGTAR